MTPEERLDKLTERHEALTMNLELFHREMQDLRGAVGDLRATAERDGENIRALARIAEIHERRLTDLEGGE
jgi:AMMECR1 domain-containing protein